MCFGYHLLVVLCRWGEFVLGIRCVIANDGAVDVIRIGAVLTVPLVVTFEPRQLSGHGGVQVVE